MCVLSREIYSQIEWYFYNYPRLKKELEDYRNDVANTRSVAIGEWGKGRSFHADPTAMKTMKLLTPGVIEKETWIKVIESTCKHFSGTEKGKLINLLYVENIKRHKICEQLFIERRTYYSWKKDILLFAAFLAQKHDLIDIEKVQHQNADSV